jgi:histidine triad (HIT) family protein
MATIFSKIIKGEIPSYKIAENNEFYAFLDIRPLAKGHTLVVPKVETDYIFDLDDTTLQGLFLFSKKVSLAIEQVISCKRIGMAVLGLEVPHAHVHLVPLQHENDLNFNNPKLELTEKEFTDIAKKISEKVSL